MIGNALVDAQNSASKKQGKFRFEPVDQFCSALSVCQTVYSFAQLAQS